MNRMKRVSARDVPRPRLLRSARGRRRRSGSRSGRGRRAGCWSGSGSAASAGTARRRWRPSTLNMLPKLLDAPMRTYLRMLANTLRPSSTPSSSTQQRLLEQDHVGRLLGDVDGGVDADADVGGVQRRRVVDAVAHEADACACATCSALMIRCLCAGETPGEQRRASRRPSASSLVGHPLDVGAEQHAVGREADLLADLARDQLVVAGDDLDRDAVRLQRARSPPAQLSFGGSRNAT